MTNCLLKSDPTLLPLPHHVMLNHLYSVTRKEEKTVILGITQRYKSKFVTTVLYKPSEPPGTSTPPMFHRSTDKKKLVNANKSMQSAAEKFSLSPPSVGDDIVFSNFENGNNDFMEIGD